MNEYANFDIELLDYSRDSARESMRARVIASPAGGEAAVDAVPTEFPGGLRDGLSRLELGQLTGDELIEVGTKLGMLLLPEHARSRFRESLARMPADAGLRIRIRADTPALAQIPWEFTCIVPPDARAANADPEYYLALQRRISIVRYEGTLPVAASQRARARDEIRVAVLLADVDAPEYPRLDVEREELNLRRALQEVARVKTDFLQPGQVEQLEFVLDRKAQVLHFTGHGGWDASEGKGYLVLATADRKPNPFDVHKLGLNLRTKGVRLVVLNACETARRDAIHPWASIAPALMRQGVPTCVGMQHSIRDASAIVFSARFFDRLAAGLSVDTAMTEARIAIFSRSNRNDRDWGAPVLYLQTDENVLFPPPPGPRSLNLALLAANLVVLGAWFYLHLYPALAAQMSRWAVGLGGVGVVGGLLWLAKSAWSLVKPRTDTERTPLLERVLRRKPATLILAPLLLVALLLAGFTGSFWLTLDESASEEAAAVSFVPGDGLPFAKDGHLRATRSHRVGGGPFFFPIRGRRTVAVVDPPGWELRQGVQPRLWLPVHLSFPSSFVRPELRLLLLATSEGIVWPRKDDEAGRTFSLKVTVTPGAGAGVASTFEANDLREGLVYLGGAEPVLQGEAQLPFDDLEPLLASCIPPGGDRSEWLNGWKDGARATLPTPKLEADDVVGVQVRNNQNGKECFQAEVSAKDIVPGKKKVLCLTNVTDCVRQ